MGAGGFAGGISFSTRLLADSCDGGGATAFLGGEGFLAAAPVFKELPELGWLGRRLGELDADETLLRLRLRE